GTRRGWGLVAGTGATGELWAVGNGGLPYPPHHRSDWAVRAVGFCSTARRGSLHVPRNVRQGVQGERARWASERELAWRPSENDLTARTGPCPRSILRRCSALSVDLWPIETMLGEGDSCCRRP